MVAFFIGIAPVIYALSTGVEKYLKTTVLDSGNTPLFWVLSISCFLVAGIGYALGFDNQGSRLLFCVRSFALALGFLGLNVMVAFAGCTCQAMNNLK
jgi:hypothetical protein